MHDLSSCLPRRLVTPKSNVGGSLEDNRTKAGRGSRRSDREPPMRDETVFRVTNSRYHANPSCDRVSSAVDVTIQRFHGAP